MEKPPYSIGKGIGLFFVLLASIPFSATVVILDTLSKQIKSQSQLEEEILKEKERLKLDNVSISGELLPSHCDGICYVHDGRYKILVGGAGATASAIRHEMKHIRNRVSGREWPKPAENLAELTLAMYSREELSATLYQFFRINL